MGKMPPPPTEANKRGPLPSVSSQGSANNAERMKDFSISKGLMPKADKIGIYGTGAIGKSSLAALVPQAGKTPLVIDIEKGTFNIDTSRVCEGIATFEDVRDVLHSKSLWDGIDVVVFDSFTILEQWAADFVLRSVPHESGHFVDLIEGYGFGKGYKHIADKFLLILQDLDAHVAAGRDVIAIMHDLIVNVPNPKGEDWLQYQPFLQEPPKNGRLRSMVRNWLDHLFYIGYDVAVNTDGKGVGIGTRTIYTQEMPTHWAKSRRLDGTFSFVKDDGGIWKKLWTNNTTGGIVS